MSYGLGDVIVIAIASIAYMVWERRRTKADASLAAREERYGLRLFRWFVLALVLLVGALVLDGIGVPGAAVIAFVALLALIALVYIAPWFGPRRRR